MSDSRVILAWILAGLALASAAARPQQEEQPARLTLLVPADAQVEFDGEPTTSVGESRRYTTPPLRAGTNYSYTVRVTSNGKTVSRKISFYAGEKATFDLRGEP